VLETPDIETSSDAYAARFAGSAGEYLLYVQAQTVAAALPTLPARASVLDVGGGHGQLIGLFEDRNCDLTLYGSDDACWERIRRLGLTGSVCLATGDLLNLPFPDRSFDLVVAVRLIAHVERWPRLLQEMCRVARKSVLIDYASKQGLNSLTPLLFALKKKIEGNTRTYASFDRAEFENILRREGFTIAVERKQFLLPMGLHRATGGNLKSLERLARASALTGRFGSPVILRADRTECV
jgi:ubiquinone/menaquinone biosynthesis C-methylase UbiE